MKKFADRPNGGGQDLQAGPYLEPSAAPNRTWSRVCVAGVRRETLHSTFGEEPKALPQAGVAFATRIWLAIAPRRARGAQWAGTPEAVMGRPYAPSHKNLSP